MASAALLTGLATAASHALWSPSACVARAGLSAADSLVFMPGGTVAR